MDSIMRVTTNSREYLAALKAKTGAIQRVTAATLNDTAEAVTLASALNVRRTMIVRTDYTTKSLKTYKASPSRPIARQDSVSGTMSDYLPIQDEGGKIKARKHYIAVPTNAVRGKDRRRRVAARYRLDAMPKAFVLRPSRPAKILTRPAMFIRQGKRGKLVKVRDLGARDYQLKARHWHTDSVKKYGNYPYMAKRFAANAKRELGIS